MTARRRRRPAGAPDSRSEELWAGFLAFWVGATVLLLGFGVATFVAVRHGHRLALVFLLLGAGCAGVASLVRRGRARRGS